MSAVPIRVHVRLDTLETRVSAGLPGLLYPVYLWSIFFKIDGATATVNSSFKLQGTATVVPTPGDHGDLPGSPTPDGITPIPPSLGDFVTILEPIPVSGLGVTVGGVVGYVEILLQQLDTPDSDIPPGHQAMNNAVQQGLNNLIPTLGAMNQTPTQADIQAIESQASSAVAAAVKNALGVGYKILTFFGLQHQDDPWGDVVTYYTTTQLAASPPKGIPLHDGIYSSVAPSPSIPIFTFVGTVVADPLPLSMRRIMMGMGHTPPTSVRSSMGSTVTPSLLAWIDKVR